MAVQPGTNIGEYPCGLDGWNHDWPSSTGVWEFQETVVSRTAVRQGPPGKSLDRRRPWSNRCRAQHQSANPPPGTPRFVGLNGQVRYLGVAIDLQDAGYHGNAFPTANGPNDTDNPLNYWYGWIGIKITNEADATGQVVGYAYENQLGHAIAAGDIGTAGVPATTTATESSTPQITRFGATIWGRRFRCLTVMAPTAEQSTPPTTRFGSTILASTRGRAPGASSGRSRARAKLAVDGRDRRSGGPWCFRLA